MRIGIDGGEWGHILNHRLRNTRGAIHKRGFEGEALQTTSGGLHHTRRRELHVLGGVMTNPGRRRCRARWGCIRSRG